MRHLPPLPTHQAILAANVHDHGDTLGWLARFPMLAMLPWVLMLVGFGHSVLAMSGEESLAQVNREIEHPKLKNLEKAGAVIFLYSLLFTSLVSFFAVMIIPDAKRPAYFANLISGLAMEMSGPYNLRLIFQGFVVLVGVLILSGAVNTAIVGANGVLNRISEDGVLTPWFRKPHGKYGTSSRLINLIAILQCVTIVLSRGNVYLLAALYAFGVIWSFSFKALAMLVLRFTEPGHRDFRVPGNIKIGTMEFPVGLVLITLLLFATALVNLMTKPLATMAGVSFSAFLFVVFVVSEKITHKQRGTEHHEMKEEFRVAEQPLIDREEMKVRPGNVLVTIRDPRNLYYLKNVLQHTDTTRQDVVVMTARIYHREPAFSGNGSYDSEELFDDYEQQLFTKVVELAEKEGKHVSLMVVPTANVFDGIVQTARGWSLRASSAASPTSSPRRAGQVHGRRLGASARAASQHRLRSQFSGGGPGGVFPWPAHAAHARAGPGSAAPHLAGGERDPDFTLHHYHIVGLALDRLNERLHGPQREEILAMLKKELPQRKEECDDGVRSKCERGEGGASCCYQRKTRPPGRAVVVKGGNYRRW